MAMAGFFFDPSPESSDATECFICKKSLDSWTDDDDPWEAHVKHGSMVSDPITLLSIINISEFVNSKYVPQAPINEQKRIPCPLTTLELEESRLYTFKYWKKPFNSHLANPVTLSKAGFYLFPKKHADDLCICYCCGLGLDSWAKDDDPMVEHEKRKPDCAHILGNFKNQDPSTFNYHLFFRGQDLGPGVTEIIAPFSNEKTISLIPAEHMKFNDIEIDIKTPSSKRKRRDQEQYQSLKNSLSGSIRKSTRLIESKKSKFVDHEPTENTCSNVLLRRETLDPLKTPSRRIVSKQRVPVILTLNEFESREENVTIKRKKQSTVQLQLPPVPIFQDHRPLVESLDHPYCNIFNSTELEQQLKQFQDMTLERYLEWMVHQHVKYFEEKMKEKISALSNDVGNNKHD